MSEQNKQNGPELDQDIMALHQAFNTVVATGMPVVEGEDTLRLHRDSGVKTYEVFDRPELKQISAVVGDSALTGVVQRQQYAINNGARVTQYNAVGVKQKREDGILTAVASNVALVVPEHRAVTYGRETSSGPDFAFAAATEAKTVMGIGSNAGTSVRVTRSFENGKKHEKVFKGAHAERLAITVAKRAAEAINEGYIESSQKDQAA